MRRTYGRYVTITTLAYGLTMWALIYATAKCRALRQENARLIDAMTQHEIRMIYRKP